MRRTRILMVLVVALAVTSVPALWLGGMHVAHAASVVYVTTTQDVDCGNSAGVSLRCAIDTANTDKSGDTIDFSQLSTSDPGYSSSTGVWTFQANSQLDPLFASSTVIDGYTAPGSLARNELCFPRCSVFPASITVQIDGSIAGSGQTGLTVFGASDTVRGLSLTNWSTAGLALFIGGGDTVTGNWIGVTPGGLAAANGEGVQIEGSNNVIGGTSLDASNVISGNGLNNGNAEAGIEISSASGNAVEGNYIGVDPAGASGMGNVGPGVLAWSNSLGLTASGNVIGANAVGLKLSPSPSSVITGNFIGTNAAGTAALGNGTGVLLYDTAANVDAIVVGGTTGAARNVISGNTGDGILVQGPEGTSIEGNYIGTDASGSNAVGNGIGIVVDGSGFATAGLDTTIGGTDPGPGNVISGNGDGIHVASAQDADIRGNWIGTNASGSTALGNSGYGIFLSDNTGGNHVGGSTAGDPNVIENNGGDGVEVGWSALSTQPTTPRAAIRVNQIYDNGGLGIDLEGETQSNCASGPSPGANDNTPCPVILAANTSYVAGTACRGCTVDLYLATNEADDNGYGEGQVFLGERTATDPCACPAGTGGWLIHPSPFLSVGEYVTATVTTPDTSSRGAETSEFARNLVVSAPISVSVRKGWNLLDRPSQLNALTESLAAMTLNIGYSVGLNAVQAMATYNNGRFAVYVSGFSTDRPLGGSQGVFVLSQSAGAWIPAGTVDISGQPVILHAGWNLVAAPYPQPSMTADAINTQITALHGTVREIADYAGSYNIWTPSGGTSLTIPYTHGMWIECSTAPTSAWTPQ